MRIEFPSQLRLEITHMLGVTRNRSIAVFVNGSLLTPDLPNRKGQYKLNTDSIEFHVEEPILELITITDFNNFRWIYIDNCWNKF